MTHKFHTGYRLSWTSLRAALSTSQLGYIMITIYSVLILISKLLLIQKLVTTTFLSMKYYETHK